MKIAVAGTGYVGLSIATLLAQHHEVTAVDVIPEKVDMINNRKSPIQDDYIEKYLAEKELNLKATLDGKAAYRNADFVVIAVPTNYDPVKNFFDTHLIEDVIGVKQSDAFANRLVCDFEPNPVGRVGVLNYRFGDVVCDIVATADEIAVASNGPFTLVADDREFDVSAGENRWSRSFAPLRVPAPPHEENLFGDWRDALPRPIFDERPELVELHNRAWEIAHTHIVDVPGLPVRRYMDCGHRSDRIWIWDTCFMALYCKYAPQEFPGIESLENFYSLLLDDDGRPLPKVVGNRWCDKDEGKMLDFMVHHPDNPPLFAWTELSYALQTGDTARLERVYLEKRWLQRWFDFFDSFNPDAPKPRGTSHPVKLRRCADGYRWAGCPSGMDNTPRGRTAQCPSTDAGRCPDNPDLLWIDALAQQGLSALCLSRIAAILGLDGESAEWRLKWAAIRDKANALYWDDADGFYYDILATGRSKVRVMTIASYWPLLAEMPTPAMAERLVAKLEDLRFFGNA